MRKYYLDNIRWLTVVLVVLYHVIYMFNGVANAGVAGAFAPVQAQDALQYILYPWFMVLLFLVSGMCAKYYLAQHTTSEFIRSKTNKLLVPSTVGLLVFQWIQGCANMQLGGAWASMSGLPKPELYLIAALSGIGVLWYIQTLWLFSMLLLLVRRVEKGRLSARCERASYSPLFLLLLGVGVWAAAQVLNTPIIAVYRFGIYGFVYFLGYFVFSQEKVTDCLAAWSLPFAAAAAVLGAVYVKTCFGQNYALSPAVNCPLAVAYLWCACLAILGLMKGWGNKTGPISRFMTRQSWGLYIFHYLPISLCGILLPKTHLAPVWIYLITTASAFGGALALYEIIFRIPLLRWCVLGITGGKKERCADVQG